MRRGTPRRSEQNQLLDEEIGKIPAVTRVVTRGNAQAFSAPWTARPFEEQRPAPRHLT